MDYADRADATAGRPGRRSASPGPRNCQLEPLTPAEPGPLPGELPGVTTDANSRHAALIARPLASSAPEMNNGVGMLTPNADPDYEPEGEAWPGLSRP